MLRIAQGDTEEAGWCRTVCPMLSRSYRRRHAAGSICDGREGPVVKEVDAVVVCRRQRVLSRVYEASLGRERRLMISMLR